MSLSGNIFAAFVAGFGASILILRLTRRRDPEGLAEHAGQEIAKAVHKAERQIEVASRKIQSAAREARK